MAIRAYREPRTSVSARTDVKGDFPNKIAQEQLLPRIAEHSRNAVKVNRQEFLFFQRKHAGRRCSCFQGQSQTPSGDCQICFRTGYVGGYDKYGCESIVLDVTHPGIQLVNVEPNYADKTRPVVFKLMDGALKGWVEVEAQLFSNVGLVDLVLCMDSASDRRNAKVTPMVLSGSSWVKLTDKSLAPLLGGNNSLRLRVELSRRLTTTDSPVFSHLLIRYRKLDRPVVYADIPRRRRSIVLQEYGFTDSYETLTMFFADEPRNISVEDIFYMLDEGTRWKVVEDSPNKPGNITTSRDIIAHLINSWEPYALIPL